MTLEELIAAFREDTDDTGDLDGEGRLWSAETLARYFTDAEAEACIRKRLIFDDTAYIDVVNDLSAYPYVGSAAPLKKFTEIMRATLYRQTTIGPPATYTRKVHDMPVATREWMDEFDCDWRTNRGVPEYVFAENARIFLPGIVAGGPFRITFEGYRTPLEALTADNMDAEPEIPEMHHRFLNYWVEHRAYGKPDSETYDPNKSARAFAQFEDYFGERPRANGGMRMRANQPARVIGYY